MNPAQLISIAAPASQPSAPPWVLGGIIVAGALTGIVIVVSRAYRLDRAPRLRARWEPMVALALFAAMLLIAPIGALIAARITGAPTAPVTLRDQAALMLGVYAVQALVALVALRVRTGHDRRDRRMPLVRAALLAVPAIVVVGLVLQAVGAASTWVVEAISGTPVDPVAHRTLRQMIAEPGSLWFLVTAGLVIVCAPILEEFMYRGLLQGAIVRATDSRWTAIWITSVVFAAMHMSIAGPQALAPLLVLSLGLGWARERTGRLIAPIVMHGLFNLGNLAVAVAT